jgi:integrase
MHGDYADANTWRRRGLIPACKAAGVDPIRWHDLRHYYASLLIFEIKHAPQEISRMMGHHDFSFTSKQYGHWLETARGKSKVGDKISAIMGGV